MTYQIWELLLNILAVNEKYPLLNRDNLRIPIQIQLSEKKNFFSQLFAEFWKSLLNFEHFESKDDSQSFCGSEVTDSENVI